MGYRSEVAFCITVDQYREQVDEHTAVYRYDKDKFKEMVGFFKLTKFYEIAKSSEYDLLGGREPRLGWDDGVIMFYVVGWKWYDGYPIVDAFYEMWDSMQDIEGISGFYLRSGEESGDVEEKEFGGEPCNEYFHVFTALSFEGNNYLGKTNTDEKEQTEQAQTDTQPDCAGANHATQA